MKPGFSFLTLLMRNIRNRPYRNGATVLCFAFVAATLFSAHYMIGGAAYSLDTGITRLGADLLVVPEQYAPDTDAIILKGEPSTFFFSSTALERAATVPGVARASPQIYVATLFGAQCCSAPVQLIGFDPERDFTISPWLSERLGKPLEKDEIIVGNRIEGEIGTTLKFFGHNYTVAGRLEPTGMGVDTSVFVRIPDAYVMAAESPVKAERILEIPPNSVSAILIQLDPSADPGEVSAEMTRRLPETRVITPDSMVTMVTEQLSGVIAILYGTTAMVTLASLPLIALISSMVANERRREIGILRATGATRRFVFRLVLFESLMLAIAGGIFGVVGSFVVIALFQDAIASVLQIPFLMPGPAAIAVEAGSAFLLAIAMGGAAALYPAHKSSRTEPYDSMRGL
ncbi:MAG: FtsX-like permease family protein [Methanoregulaceae archaeon]|nr:FtsX-like permease family protein [Methanoregulaceae archaeon]